MSAEPLGAVPDGEASEPFAPIELLRELRSAADQFACSTDAQYVFACLSHELGALIHERDGMASPGRGAADRPGALWAQTLESVVQAEQLIVQLAEAQAEIAQLRVAVANNRDIGVALGIVMSRERVTRDEAFYRLRLVSRHRQLKLREVATRVIDTGCLDEPTPPFATHAQEARGSRRCS